MWQLLLRKCSITIICLILYLRCLNCERQSFSAEAPLKKPPGYPDKLFPQLKVKVSQKISATRQPNNMAPDQIIYRNISTSIATMDELYTDHKLWKNGIVPYYIDVLSFSDKVLRDRIRSFLNIVNGLTKIRFMELPTPPKDDATRYVFFMNRQGLLGCADHCFKNFTTTGVQHVVLGYECMSTGGELAEAVLAIVGVIPQHNWHNRDDYIKVIEANILPEKKYLFEKYEEGDVFLDSPEDHLQYFKYDFLSAGHYHSHKYSANGRATIELKIKYSGMPIGEAIGLSDMDIMKIDFLYSHVEHEDNIKRQLPTCNKLFIRDPSMKKTHLNDIHAQKKPKKYLGIPNENTDYVEEIEDNVPLETVAKGDEEKSNNEEVNSDNGDSEDNVENEDDEESEGLIEKGHVPSIESTRSSAEKSN